MLKIRKGLLVISASLLLAGCFNNDKKPSNIVEEPKASLKVLTAPTKTQYNCGNNFDKTGLTLEYTDKDGNKTTVTDFTLSEDKNLTYDQTYVKASYNNLSVNIDIDVNEVIEGQLTCVGDSLTHGHYWKNEAYPVYIPDNLGGHLLTVSNCGRDGASFKTFGQYNPAYNTTEQYQTSLTGNPIVISIMLGTNDATNWANEKDLYVQDYTDLVNLYRTTFGEQVKIIVMTSPRCISPNDFGIPNDTICNEVVPLQKQIAEDLDCYLLDLNAEFNKYSDSDLFRPNDGVHFTKNAAEITAKLLAEKIKSIYGI